MSSRRFPGKVLAPFHGQPIISHVISQVARVIPNDRITVATSDEPSDNPLALYVRELGVSVYRGALENVFERFQGCLRKNTCDWFFRISADSPLLNSDVLMMMLGYAVSLELDLVTNVQVRTFPKGHSAEMIRSATFAAIESSTLTLEEQEHLTKVFYNNPTKFRIMNIQSADPNLAQQSCVVDTLEDLFRLEKTEVC